MIHRNLSRRERRMKGAGRIFCVSRPSRPFFLIVDKRSPKRDQEPTLGGRAGLFVDDDRPVGPGEEAQGPRRQRLVGTKGRGKCKLAKQINARSRSWFSIFFLSFRLLVSLMLAVCHLHTRTARPSSTHIIVHIPTVVPLLYLFPATTLSRHSNCQGA